MRTCRCLLMLPKSAALRLITSCLLARQVWGKTTLAQIVAKELGRWLSRDFGSGNFKGGRFGGAAHQFGRARCVVY